MEETFLEIESPFTREEVVKKLKEITVDPDTERQTKYHEVFIGKVSDTEATLESIYVSGPKNKTIYRLTFYGNANTRIKIATNDYEKRVTELMLIKGLGIPILFTLVTLILIFGKNITVSLITILIFGSLVYLTFKSKAKPLKQEEFENDKQIKHIITALNARVAQNK